MKTLEDLRAERGGSPVNFGGYDVWSTHRVLIPPGSVLSIKRLQAKEEPVQGLRLDAKGGLLLVNGMKVKSPVLWADSSPREVTLAVSGNKAVEVTVWNQWRAGPTSSAWFGNSGMVVLCKGTAVILSCSDGIGDVDFKDLVVSLEVHNAVDGLGQG